MSGPVKSSPVDAPPAASDLRRQKREAREAVRRRKVVCAYWPLPDEVDVRPLIDALREAGRRVCLPAVVGDELVWRPYEGEERLREGRVGGVLEPTTEPDGRLDNACVIVPGLAFTPDGQRLGRGRGYYDRALARMPGAWSVGVAFDCQMCPTLPAETHDRRVDMVISR